VVSCSRLLSNRPRRASTPTPGDAAWCHAQLGDLKQAIACGERALALQSQNCDPGAEADILDIHPTNYLQSSLLDFHPDQLEANSAEDPYYKRYRLLSTVYRLCAFLGWLELYRQDVTFLNAGEKKDSKLLEKALENIRNDLADGRLNAALDFQKWNDRLIFREEQRAIGEAMITGTSPRMVMGTEPFMCSSSTPEPRMGSGGCA
jgi:hypothetical protein